MKASRFCHAQKAFILKQGADGIPVADLSLDKEMLQDVIRRACRILEMDTSTYHYKSRRREQAGIAARIREICETRVRYGYRRGHGLLRREGWEINMKRTHRIYNELGVQLRNKTPKRMVSDQRRPTGGVWNAG